MLRSKGIYLKSRVHKSGDGHERGGAYYKRKPRKCLHPSAQQHHVQVVAVFVVDWLSKGARRNYPLELHVVVYHS